MLYFPTKENPSYGFQVWVTEGYRATRTPLSFNKSYPTGLPLAVQRLRLPFKAEGVGLIPGQGAGSATYGWSSTSLCLRFYKICKVGEITTSS